MERTYLVVERKSKKKLESRINKLLENNNCELVGGVAKNDFNNYIQAVIIKE